MSIDNPNFEKYFDYKKYSSSNQELKKKYLIGENIGNILLNKDGKSVE